jgi:hypothetical protein
LLELISTLLLIVHLLCVNVAAGGPILCVWLEWRGDGLARRAAAYMSRMSLLSLIGGGLLGLAICWLKWTPGYRALWTGPLSYKLHWGAAEILFSLAMALVYWLLVRGKGGNSTGSRVGRGAVALLNGTNLLYHFPPLFVVVDKLYTSGQIPSEIIRGAQFRQLAWTHEVPALVFHFAFASVAVAGVMLMGLALRWMRQDQPPTDIAKVAVWGSCWALGASLVQLPLGLWMLAVLPSTTQSSLMGNELVGTSLFIAAMLAVFWQLRELAGVALGEVTRPALIRAMSAMLVTIALMTAMQQSVRPVAPNTTAPNSTTNASSYANGVSTWLPKS